MKKPLTQADLDAALRPFPPTSTRSCPPSEWSEGGQAWMLPSGVLVEWCGIRGGGKMEALLPRLSARGVWISAALPAGVVPTTEFFPLVLRDRLQGWWGVRTPTHELGWCLLQILRSQCVDQILLDESLAAAWGEGDEPARVAWLRRLQIAAERAGASVIFLREQPSRAGVWPIAIQVQAQRVGSDASVQLSFKKWFSRRTESSWETPGMPASSFQRAFG